MVDLLGNSISNLTGIGTGITMKDKNSIQNFKEEFVTNFVTIKNDVLLKHYDFYSVYEKFVLIID